MSNAKLTVTALYILVLGELWEATPPFQTSQNAAQGHGAIFRSNSRRTGVSDMALVRTDMTHVHVPEEPRSSQLQKR
uniref:Secreted protein n=1 Tax=Knipowitschia caucasica TaxID=637954 RepID=A0AAV2J6X8_KNICA